MLMGLLSVGIFQFDRASAQTESATLKVLVRDVSEAITPGARVTLTNVDTNAVQTQTTDSEGYVVFAPVHVEII